MITAMTASERAASRSAVSPVVLSPAGASRATRASVEPGAPAAARKACSRGASLIVLSDRPHLSAVHAEDRIRSIGEGCEAHVDDGSWRRRLAQVGVDDERLGAFFPDRAGDRANGVRYLQGSSRIAAATSAAWVSSAKWPVSRNRM